LRHLLGARADLLVVPSHCETTWRQISHEAP